MFVACVVLCAMLLPAGAADAHHFAKRTLAKGASGPDVRVLQDLLTRVGHRTSVDGRFGTGTRRALRRWERAGGHRVDGRLHVSEARALVAAAKATEASAPAAAPAPAPQAPVEKATIAADGVTAIAPASAPEEVKQIIAAGNEIATKPYRYGGGHARFPKDSGYDCSGSMSYALYGAGLLEEPLDSTGFMSFGKSGKGRWVTIYAHGGHGYLMVAGLRFDTSGMSSDNGSRWHKSRRSTSGYTVRHISGL